jgi:hypothetical protein
VVLAGPAAHKKRHPYAHWLDYKIGDMRDAYDVIERHDAWSWCRPRLLCTHRSPRGDFVAKFWFEIEAVARALVERGTLSDDEVRRVAINGYSATGERHRSVVGESHDGETKAAQIPHRTTQQLGIVPKPLSNKANPHASMYEEKNS